MTKLIYSRDEIESEHAYSVAHRVCGRNLHGGFSADGNYVSPRTLVRWSAVKAWHKSLADQGKPILEATTELLSEPNFPNADQQLLLIRSGLGQSLWDSLTITGIIEGRGKALAEVEAPDYQTIIREDISATALGHMNRGLLTSHGWDEGGNPATGLGGHDIMWFVVRDLLFGEDAYPIPQPPGSIGRDKSDREMEQIPPEYEGFLAFLMNLLMIEVRAERAFQFYQSVISDPQVFTDRREAAATAVELIDRIRQDESVHVAWLKVAISEFRASTVLTVGGEEVPGSEIIDPVWEKMIHWHAVEMHEVNRDTNRSKVKERILAHPEGENIFSQFEALAA